MVDSEDIKGGKKVRRKGEERVVRGGKGGSRTWGNETRDKERRGDMKGMDRGRRRRRRGRLTGSMGRRKGSGEGGQEKRLREGKKKGDGKGKGQERRGRKVEGGKPGVMQRGKVDKDEKGID